MMNYRGELILWHGTSRLCPSSSWFRSTMPHGAMPILTTRPERCWPSRRSASPTCFVTPAWVHIQRTEYEIEIEVGKEKDGGGERKKEKNCISTTVADYQHGHQCCVMSVCVWVRSKIARFHWKRWFHFFAVRISCRTFAHKIPINVRISIVSDSMISLWIYYCCASAGATINFYLSLFKVFVWCLTFLYSYVCSQCVLLFNGCSECYQCTLDRGGALLHASPERWGECIYRTPHKSTKPFAGVEQNIIPRFLDPTSLSEAPDCAH